MGFEGFAAARSIAIVGLSERNLLARITAGNLVSRGFAGRVVGLHPRSGDVEGIQVVPELDEAVDLGVLCVGAPRLAPAIRDLSGRGVQRFVVPGAGANEGGREVEAELRAAVEETAVEVVGPNCMGFVSMPTRCVPYVGTLDPDLREGSVGLVSQSGSVCELFTALPDRVGFSHIVSVGNELTLDLTEALRFLVDDDATEAIGLFVEGVRRPEAFREELRRAAEVGKPVVVLKVGSSEAGRAGAASHTGALAGDARVFSGIVRDAGATEVHDLDELFVALELLGKRLSRPPGSVVVAGDSGGQANLAADLAETAGVELPELAEPTIEALRARFPTLGDATNPLDLWALDEPDPTYRDGVRILLDHEPHLVVLALDKFLARTAPERAFVRAGVETVTEPGALVLLAYAGGDDADPEILRTCWDRLVPVVRGAGTTFRVLAALDRWRRRRAEPAGPERGRLLDAPDVGGGPWTEHAAKRLLREIGIPVTREEEVREVEEAVEAAQRIGFPVVAKAAGIAHKTEVGGVRLGLATEQAVREAAAEVLRLGAGLLVSEEVRGRLELLVGAFRDAQFGVCGLLGLGGIWTEALGQAVVLPGPGSEDVVRRALEDAPWGRLLLEDVRGVPLPLGRVTDVLFRLIDLVEGMPVEAIEINPLVVREDGVVAVDALLVPREGAR